MSVKFGTALRLRPQPRFYLLLIALVLLSLLLSSALSCLRIHRLDGRIEEMQAERAAQIEALAALQARLEYVQTDAYVEEIARRELNLLYPWEIRYIAG